MIDAEFSKSGDPRYFWTERVKAHGEEIALTWYDIGEPLLIHTQPNQQPGRPYGVCTVLIPALGARLTRNGVDAAGQPVAARARGAAVQHLRAGVLGELDGGEVAAQSARELAAAGSRLAHGFARSAGMTIWYEARSCRFLMGHPGQARAVDDCDRAHGSRARPGTPSLRGSHAVARRGTSPSSSRTTPARPR